jgi:hydrogenase-4 component B
MNPIDIFVGALAVLGATSVLALLAADRRTLVGVINFVGTACAAAAMLWLAAKALAAGPIEFTLGGVRVLGLTAELAFRMDGLSALFLIIIAVLFTAAALYGIGYLAHYKRESLRRYYFPFPLFMAGMLAVVTTSDWFWFLVFWEFMTLVSYFLVIFEYREKQNLAAGFIYFFMTQSTSAGLMLVVIFLSNRTGSFAFASLPDLFRSLAQSNPWALHALLALFFIAFATKAGMYPLGIWLPEAHPAAPASISALLSGVMIKIGVYGLLRVFVWTLPVSAISSAWGTVIASLGVVSMLIGTLRALGENDSKRLLAQSSIGQMGYILLGLGLGMAFLPHSPLFGAVALAGCLYHVINHACFKSLLFFNSGSILYRTGTRDLNQLGGLVKVMPLAAACAVVGALAIAGAPPLNGFASKWLLYQSAILGETGTPLFVLYGVVAIFVGTLTLACFVKYLGSAYLGTLAEGVKTQESEERITAGFPSALSPGERGEGEGSLQSPSWFPGAASSIGEHPSIPKSMQTVEVFLASACVLLGLFPLAVVGVLMRVLEPALAAARSAAAATGQAQGPPLQAIFSALPWGGVAVSSNGVHASAAAPLLILAALSACLGVAYFIYRSVSVASRPAAIWNCGELVADEAVRYRAASFFKPFMELVQPLCRPVRWPQLTPPDRLTRALDLDRWIYFPIASAFVRLSRMFSRLHSGRPQLYLLWQVLGLAVSLGLVFWLKSGR